jgi:hypothetical protein
MKRLERNLIEGSVEAFLLALEIVNKITVEYRLECFTFLFCNAWELLLKARLFRNGQNIFYRKQKGQLRRSLSLSDCIGRVFTNVNDPIRLNIEAIQELRDCAIHLVIPIIPIDVFGLFQAGIINYADKLKEWTGQDLSKRVPLGMMSLIYDLDPATHSLDSAVVRRRMSTETVKWLKNFQDVIKRKMEDFEDGRERMYIPINLNLAIVKNPDRADIVISAGGTGTDVLLINVAKDFDKTHPYRQKEVIQEVNKRSSSSRKVNSHDILCIRRAHNIDGRSDMCHKPKFGSPQYSDTFVQWIVDQHRQSPDFFDRARAKSKSTGK